MVGEMAPSVPVFEDLISSCTRVFDAYHSGLTIRPALERVAMRIEPGELPIHQPALERAVLDLLNEDADSAAVEQLAAA